ncbi:hypothetical protein TSAR_015530 [Trichomalopsis sarcophagae]|uniref:Uncharacterized protein n=1 Tax=Trichomalopsis sarcophagae TaxID=543379 RepID=A0A232EII3_9HYME|nr:hypothetical protein TSAR_015530 [Trichomalopsis sarcophagae]
MYKHDVLTDFVLFKCNYYVKSVMAVLKVTNDERLIKSFRNRLLCQFLLNCLGSAVHPEPYGFGVKKYSMLIQIKLKNFSPLGMISNESQIKF